MKQVISGSMLVLPIASFISEYASTPYDQLYQEYASTPYNQLYQGVC